jgi:hypothetical protein
LKCWKIWAGKVASSHWWCPVALHLWTWLVGAMNVSELLYFFLVDKNYSLR